jgi:hypothetical protein
MTLDGGDVYVCGYGLENGIYARALYWKNGTEVWMNPDTASSSWSILKQGSDIYVTGTLNGKAACYWKNGQLVVLSPDSVGLASAAGIAMLGNDVYIVGGVSNRSIAGFNAVYWKNGQLFYLTNPSVPGQAISITVSGNDIYIGGNALGTNGQYNAVYWKNGKQVELPNAAGNGFGYVFGLAVTLGSQ